AVRNNIMFSAATIGMEEEIFEQV
ncbi:hypothetical protein AVEN_37409-1, partial [Araneus ventricosus]